MTRLSLNKSSLTKEVAKRKTFRQFLPSLDLKRRQLMGERAKARNAAAVVRRDFDAVETEVRAGISMLADRDVDLTGLARVAAADVAEENVVGTRLPVLRDAVIEVADYALLAKPHWVDHVAALLARQLEFNIRLQVAERRLEVLEAAVRTITQRVNLFEKVLIPRAESNIRQIKLFLADAERAGVVRAKLAKSKQRRES